MPQLTLPFERPERLNRQQTAILERLRQGPAKNVELSQLALRYSARICELRQMGHRIEIIERGEETGVAVYGLKNETGGVHGTGIHKQAEESSSTSNGNQS